MRTRVAGMALLVALLTVACTSNGAVVLKMPSGSLNCQNDWDDDEVRERRSSANDVSGFSPGKTCAELGYTRRCPATGDKVFFLPEYRC